MTTPALKSELLKMCRKKIDCGITYDKILLIKVLRSHLQSQTLQTQLSIKLIQIE